jgi:protein-tyrosine phosphatase
MFGRQIDLSTAFNVRDLGGFPTAGGGSTRFGRAVRSDALHRVDGRDEAVLSGLALRAVYDLRSPSELDSDGLGNFVGRRVPHYHAPMMAVTLNPYDDTIDWRGINLEERYVAMLEEGETAIRSVLAAVADPAPGPVLFHCSAGKDRTGVLTAILLSAVGVDDDAIAADYRVSQGNIAHVIEGYREQMKDAGLDDNAIAYLISSPPERMHYTLARLRERWGGVVEYLDAIGFGPTDREQLRRNFVQDLA